MSTVTIAVAASTYPGVYGDASIEVALPVLAGTAAETAAANTLRRDAIRDSLARLLDSPRAVAEELPKARATGLLDALVLEVASRTEARAWLAERGDRMALLAAAADRVRAAIVAEIAARKAQGRPAGQAEVVPAVAGQLATLRAAALIGASGLAPVDELLALGRLFEAN